ncbi:MAG: hypothetical protein B6245_17880 [Desulfobacteraceae bacterium 4572_88]|nr:MAG: hypothetical protein B6245_17880 [Desulfobacteraceae bacterium 4572_88]
MSLKSFVRKSLFLVLRDFQYADDSTALMQQGSPALPRLKLRTPENKADKALLLCQHSDDDSCRDRRHDPSA